MEVERAHMRFSPGTGSRRAFGQTSRPPDEEEPFRVAEAVARMGLRYAVVTSVKPDDQPTAARTSLLARSKRFAAASPVAKSKCSFLIFARLERVRCRSCRAPGYLNHNTETVPRLYRQVRKGAVYERSLELLRRSKEAHPEVPTKTGLMLGLGEEKDESPRYHAGSCRAGYETFSRSDSICSPLAIICQSFATFIPTSLPNTRFSAKAMGFNTSKPARWCVPLTTPLTRPNQPLSNLSKY